MWCIRTELDKIKKSKMLMISMLMLMACIIIYYPINVITTPDMSIFKFIYRGFSLLAYYPIFVPPVLFVSLIIGKEFQDRTMTYTFIRPIKYYKLFISKIIAVCLYSFFIVTVYFLSTVIFGLIFFEIKSFEFDANMTESVIRCITLFAYTFIGTIIITGLSAIISLLCRNMVSSCIISMIVWAIVSLAVFKFPMYGEIVRIPISTYYSPAWYYQSEISVFLSKCLSISKINILVIIFELIIAYWIGLRFRKGLKNNF